MTPEWWSGLLTGLAIGFCVGVPVGWFTIPPVVREVIRWHRGS
jgi:hypothetical protein